MFFFAHTFFFSSFSLEFCRAPNIFQTFSKSDDVVPQVAKTHRYRVSEFRLRPFLFQTLDSALRINILNQSRDLTDSIILIVAKKIVVNGI